MRNLRLSVISTEISLDYWSVFRLKTDRGLIIV